MRGIGNREYGLAGELVALVCSIVAGRRTTAEPLLNTLNPQSQSAGRISRMVALVEGAYLEQLYCTIHVA